MTRTATVAAALFLGSAGLLFSVESPADGSAETPQRRERLKAGENPDFARRLENLADLYLLIGRRAEAEALYRRAHEIRQRHAALKR